MIDLRIELSNETGEELTELQLREMVESIRLIVRGYGYDISGYGPSMFTYIAEKKDGDKSD